MPGVFGLSSGPDAAAKPPGFAELLVSYRTLAQFHKVLSVAFAPPLTLLANITAQRDA